MIWSYYYRWVCWLLRDLVSIIGCGDAGSVHNALVILKVICFSFKDKVQPMSSILIILLNKLEDFSVVDTRQVLNILSFLSHAEEGDVFGDIHILVQKKLSSIEVHSLRIGKNDLNKTHPSSLIYLIQIRSI